MLAKEPAVRSVKERRVTNVRVTVLGCSLSIPNPGRACSSYLVENGQMALIMDMGTGSFANMRRHLEYDKVDAIVITHMHADHFIDLIPMRYALRYGPIRRSGLVDLFLPPDGERMLRQLVDAFAYEGGGDFLDEVFNVVTYDPDRSLKVGGATLTFAPTTHYIPAYAVRYEYQGMSFVYSGDTAPDPRVVEIADGGDLFLCEASLRTGETEVGIKGHSSARDAGKMAREAGVKALVLTHYTHVMPKRELIEQAALEFDGEVVVAEDHRQWLLEGGQVSIVEQRKAEDRRAARESSAAAR